MVFTITRIYSMLIALQLILMCTIIILLVRSIKKSKFVVFLEEFNYFSPVKKYYEYTNFNGNTKIKNIDNLKYF